MNKHNLERSEWDFCSCPAEERDTCLQYEYAREFVRIRPELVLQLAFHPRPQPYGHFLVFAQSKETNKDGLPALCPSFPTLAWLDIPQAERSFWIDVCKPLPEEDPDNPSLLVPDGFDIALLQKWDEERESLASKWLEARAEQLSRAVAAIDEGKPFEEKVIERSNLCNGPKRYYAIEEGKAYAVIIIDWSWNDHQFQQAFDQIMARRPKNLSGQKIKKSKVGRGRARDRLNWLGARRLHRYYGTYEEAIIAVDSAYADCEQGAPYTNVDALRLAAKKSDACLAEFTKAGRFSAFDIFDRNG